MSKNFKLTRKPGQNESLASGNNRAILEENVARHDSNDSDRLRQTAISQRRNTAKNDDVDASLTTRKTIEVPESYFYRVKMRALERKMKEKELWSEIVSEYFVNHPTK